MLRIANLPADTLALVRRGTVIPALPLALHADRTHDRRHQQALCRYYVDAGAGGLAVGVHSTQFEIRDPGIDLFEPLLRQASQCLDAATQGRPFLKVAGICGATPQALREARFAVDNGYHAGLLSLAALKGGTVDELIAHCTAVARVMPIIGFYLQPAVGGRVLPYDFWRRFADIENVLAIKMAPFNRYQTFDVVRAVADADRQRDITLYTGNDDNIVLDLLTPYHIATADGATREVRIVGGLLGHWAVWTRKAVELLDELHRIVHSTTAISPELLARAVQITDTNAVLFDAANAFHGCIPGIHEVLRRQGLLQGTWCLNPREVLSPGQAAEIDRVYTAYPHLNDDAFVAAHLRRWLEE